MTIPSSLPQQIHAAAAQGVPHPGLERLHEIILPDPVPWIPLTAGWYALFTLILVAAGWWGYGQFRRSMRNRYRRLALRELSIIEDQLAQSGRRPQALAQISILLKRTALSAFPRADVAWLSGDRWLAFLDKTMGVKEFTQGEGRLLSELPFAPVSHLEGLQGKAIDNLLRLTRRWIQTHASV